MLVRIGICTMLAMALAAPPLQADRHNETTTDFHKAAKVSNLMARVESNALDIREQAARLRSYNRTPQLYSWELHADELNRISGELDRMADLVAELKPLKPNMTFRQNAAFNQIVSLSASVSDATKQAIQTVNTEKEKLAVAHPEYEKSVNTIYDEADRIVAHADNVEAWAEFIEELQESSDD